MLGMGRAHVIRHKRENEGLPIREIARDLGVSRNTVRKYLDGDGEPQRREAGKRPQPVLDAVRVRIDELLREWGQRTTPKQRVTGTLVHQRLRAEGYQVGSTTVRAYLAEQRRARQEVYVPLVWRPGVPVPSAEIVILSAWRSAAVAALWSPARLVPSVPKGRAATRRGWVCVRTGASAFENRAIPSACFHIDSKTLADAAVPPTAGGGQWQRRPGASGVGGTPESRPSSCVGRSIRGAARRSGGQCRT